MSKQLFLFLLFTLLLISCTDEKVVIDIIGENASNLKALNSIKHEYEALTGARIVFHPYSFADAFNKSNQDLIRKNPIYDIIMQYNFSLSSFVRNKYVFSVDELKSLVLPDKLKFEENLFENAWREVGFYYSDPTNLNSELIKVGYPFASNTMILVYNKHLFENKDNKKKYEDQYDQELLPPDNWPEYLRLAEFFTDKKHKIYGVCLQGAADSWLYYEWCNFLFGFDGKVMKKEYGWQGDENTEILVNSQQAIDATNFYLKLKPYNAGDYFTVGSYEQILLMKRGNIAMSIIWSDLAYELITEGDGKFDERFGFVPIPGNVSGLAGGSFFINRNSENYKEAFKYIVEMMQKENQIKLIKKGLCSANEKAYDSPDVCDIPYVDALKKSLKRGKYMFEAGPDADMISQKITTFIQRIWKEDLDTTKALNELKKEIETDRMQYFVIK